MNMTENKAKQLCLKFKPGDQVNIISKSIEQEHGTKITVNIPAIVVQKYQYYLLTQKQNGIRECFRYTDIVLFGVIEKKRGRKKGAA